MTKKLLITTNTKEFKKVLDAHTDKDAHEDRRRRIIKKYSSKYSIKNEVITYGPGGRKIHIDYLPTIDMLLKAKEKYFSPQEVVGAALFKLELDHCIFLTDLYDANLHKNYQTHKEKADTLAERLWELNSEEFDNQFTHVTARILSGAYHTVFEQFYGDWRKSLQQKDRECFE